MSHPHNYSLETAPKAYLERVFISSRPRQITFAALIGPYRLHVLDITQHYTSLKAGNGEPFIAQAITSDRNGIHGVYGPIKHYLLIIDQQPVAVYDTDGRYISAADDEKPCPARASVHIGDSSATVRVEDTE